MFCIRQQGVGIEHRFLEARRGHQLFQVVGRIDDHQHPGAGIPDLLQPACEQGHVQGDDDVRGPGRFQGSLALADGGNPDLGPGRNGIDAHFIHVCAQVFGRGEGRFYVLAPGGEIAQQHYGLALLHIAEFEFFLEQYPQLGRVQFLYAGNCRQHVMSSP